MTDNPVFCGLAVIFTFLFLLSVRSFFKILPSLWDCIQRWKGSLDLEDSLQMSGSRDLIAVILFAPLCMVAYSHDLYHPDFMDALRPELGFAALCGCMLAYLILRSFLDWQLEMGSYRAKTFTAANRSFRNYMIIVFTILLPLGAVCRVLTENEELTRSILLHATALTYLFHIFRRGQIFASAYTAIIFSSRHTIDAFYGLCDELRVKVPETMKYFCTTEAVAMYLQKHIVYRKRKIFYGNGTPDSIIEQIGTKHKGEKFLVTQSDSSNSSPLTNLMDAQKLDYKTAVFVKSVPQDLKDLNLQDYDMIVFYNPYDIKSLYENFPEFQQGDIKFVAYGKSIVKAMEEAGLRIEIQAPTPEAPSVARAIEIYLGNQK